VTEEGAEEALTEYVDTQYAGTEQVGGEQSDVQYRQHRYTRPPGATEIVLVRHAESAPYRPGTPFPAWQGHGDPELAPEGVEQARRLCARLGAEHIDAIYVSPLRRTSQTIAELADRLDLTPVVEPDLREVHLGEWEHDGTFRRHVAEHHPIAVQVFTDQRWDVIPGAESNASLASRARDALTRIAAAHSDQRVVVVAHAGVIAMLLAVVAESAPFAFVGVDNASISEVVVMPERWMLRRFNDTAHLPDS